MNSARFWSRSVVVATTLAVLVFTPKGAVAQGSCETGDTSLVGYWSFDEGVGTSAADSSGLGNTGILLNGAGWSAGASGAAGDFALALDGVQAYVDAGSDSSLDSLATLTYAAWIHPTGAGDREIFSKLDSTHELRLKGTGSALALRGCVVASGNACSESTPGALPLDSWTHVAMTYDHAGDRQVHLYIDGIEVSYVLQSTAGSRLESDAPGSQLFGRRQNGSRYFAGFLDEMRIYNAVLDQCRIEELAAMAECVVEADCDNDGLLTGNDPCPDDALNRCVGPVAACGTAPPGLQDCIAGTPLRLDYTALPETTDCNGDVWDADTGAGNDWSGDVAATPDSVTAVFGCSDVDTETMIGTEKSSDPLIRSYPIANGTYVVNLLFAEIHSPACAAGDRTMDIWLESANVLGGPEAGDGFDQYAIAEAIYGAGNGCGALVVRSAVVEVTDGTLDLVLDEDDSGLGETDSALKAIEVLAFDSDNDGLPDADDPCPADVRNLCFGPVAVGLATNLRVNAGGFDVFDCSGEQWYADFGFNQGNTASEDSPIAGIDAMFGCADASTESLFQFERWDEAPEPELAYSFGVADGEYLVNLLFANLLGGGSPEHAVFDIAIEGAVVYDDFDQVAAAGGDLAAVVRSAQVTVLDGNGLQIEFLHTLGDPAVKGIEVLADAACETTADCDDGLFCNGSESCDEVTGSCIPGIPPVCDDGFFCNGTETCNEVTDSCIPGMPPVCDDGFFCNGTETCSEVTDSCDPGTAVNCSDAIGCTIDTCNEGADSCDNVTTDSLCADGDLCNGTETCDALLDCQDGTPVTCNPGEVCEPTTGSCGGSCDSGGGALVGYWIFDEGAGASAADHSGLGNTGTLLNGAGWSAGVSGELGDFALALDGVDDYVSAGSDSSLDNLATLTYAAWIYPTGDGDREIFSKSGSNHELRLKGAGSALVLRGCIVASAANACSESTLGAVPLNTWTHVAMTYDDFGDRLVHLYVDGVEVAHASQSQAAGSLVIDASAPQLLGSRSSNGRRAFAGSLDEMRIYNAVLDPCRIAQLAETNETGACVVDADCDDGLFCDGIETCGVDLRCQAGSPVICTDGVSCTDDFCNESTDSCDHTPVDDLCDDGFFCNGSEICDVNLDCQAGGDPCPGQSCDEGTDTCGCIDDSDCSDGIFCNGDEVCSAGICQGGTPVDCSDGVFCTIDACNEGSDSCDHTASDVSCADGDLCNGVETCDAILDCQVGTAVICDPGEVCEPSTGICGGEACDSGNASLVAYWAFDEGAGTIAADSSGTGNTGTLLGGAGWSAGASGDGGDFAVALNGYKAHVNAGSDASLDTLATPTYAAWVYPTANGDREIFSKGGSRHELRLKGGGSVLTLRGCIVTSGKDACSDSASGVVPLNAWTHVAMTYDDSGDRRVHLYVGGIEVSYGTQSTAGGPPVSDASASQLLGSRSSNGRRAFAGSLDEMRIYDTVLDLCRIAQLAENETVPGDNLPPVLDPIGDQSVPEGAELTFTATASDPESPPQTLSFSLSGAVPAGAIINPVTGVFTWTPTAAQGPAEYPLDVVVTDNGSPSLEDRETITVMVEEQYPTAGWSTSTPEDQGMDSAVLDEAVTFAQSSSQPGSGIIVRNGVLVREWGSQTERYDLKSTTKSIGSIMLGRAVQAGLVTLDDLAQTHLPEVGTPPSNPPAWLDDLRLWHLATHTGGFEKTGGFGDMVAPPGTEWSYSDGSTNWLADVLTVKFGQDLQGILQADVLGPMGLTYFGDPAPDDDWFWRPNAYRGHTINGIERREFGSGIHANVDTLARIGYLFLNDGRWDGQQLLPTGFADLVSEPYPPAMGLPSGTACSWGDGGTIYGVLWWNNLDGGMPGVPTDAYFSYGLYDSHIVVIPSLQIVAARAAGSGGSWGTEASCSPDWREGLTEFVEPMVRSVLGSP